MWNHSRTKWNNLKNRTNKLLKNPPQLLSTTLTTANITHWTFQVLKTLNYSMTLLDQNRFLLTMKISWLPENSPLVSGQDWLSYQLECPQLTFTGSWKAPSYPFSSGYKSCISTWKEENHSLNHYWLDFIEELQLTKFIILKSSIMKM